MSIPSMLQKIIRQILGLEDEFESLHAELDQARSELQDVKVTQLEHTTLLKKILAAVTPGPAVSVYWVITDPDTGEIISEGENPLQVTLNRHTRRHVKPTFKDADGNATTLDQQDTPTAVTSANPAVTIENLNPATGEFDLVIGALAGVGPVSLSGDADLAAGQTQVLTGTLDTTVPPGNAVSVDFEIGAEQSN